MNAPGLRVEPRDQFGAIAHCRCTACRRLRPQGNVAEWQGPRRSVSLHPLVQLDQQLREEGREREA